MTDYARPQQKLAVQSNFDDFVLAELYSQWLSPQHQRQEELTRQVTTMLGKLSGTTDIASEAVQQYIDVLDQALLGLDPNNANRSRDSVNKVISATYAIKASQQKLKDQLDFSNEQCHALRSELDHLKKERQLDPLTGLYNRLAMQEHLDLWLTENPGRRIAAIAVNLDHFSQFNQDYGFGVGDVGNEGLEEGAVHLLPGIVAGETPEVINQTAIGPRTLLFQ